MLLARFKSAVCHFLPGPGQGESDKPQPLRSKKQIPFRSEAPGPRTSASPPVSTQKSHTLEVNSMDLSKPVLIANIHSVWVSHSSSGKNCHPQDTNEAAGLHRLFSKPLENFFQVQNLNLGLLTQTDAVQV